MSKTRSQLTRLLFIDRELRKGGYPNTNTLGNGYEVSPRTIARDIEYMRDMLDAPIAYDESRKGYYYSEPNYSLPSVDIRESEFFALCVAEKALEQYAGTPLYDRLSSVFEKLRSFLPESIRVNTTWIGSRISFLEAPGPVVGPGTWETVAGALRDGTTIRITHRAPGREPTGRDIDPYHLAVNRGQWYVIAYCHLKGEVRTFALSRIIEAKTTMRTYAIPADFNFTKYLGAHFGIMAEGKEYTARIWFSPENAPYIRERIWHDSQSLTENRNGSIVLSFTTNSVLEVKRWILSWGAGAKVLSPKSLADEIKGELSGALKNY